MRKIFILLNHELTSEQNADIKREFGECEFINIADKEWGNIDPNLTNIEPFLRRYKARLSKTVRGDILLIQGDFGATYNMVNFAKNSGIKAIYATTKRVAKEEICDGKIVIKREFAHVMFREYI